MRSPENRLLGHLLYGSEGMPRDPRDIAYYHRADMLRAAAESAGYMSLVSYSRQNPNDYSAIRRLTKGSWVKDRFQNCRAVYAAVAEPAGLAGWALRKTSVPVLYDVHTPPVGEKWLQFLLNKSARNFAIYVEACISELIAIRKSDMLLWCSLIQRDYYQRRGFPLDRMREIRHGVDLTRFDIGPPANTGAPLLCYAGTMVPYQGADRLVGAYEKVGRDKLRLKMIGFTEKDADLRKRAEAAGIECVSQIPHSQLLDEMKQCDCTVIVAHPDAVRYKNGAAPTKWPESLALGRPIISGNAYDTAQLIRELGVGWVVDNSVDGLAEGMRKLAETPREEILEMGRRARAEAVRNYGWETIGRKFIEAIESSTKR